MRSYNFEEIDGLVEKLIHLHELSKLHVVRLKAENAELKRKLTEWENKAKAGLAHKVVGQMDIGTGMPPMPAAELKKQLSTYIEAIEECLKTMNG